MKNPKTNTKNMGYPEKCKQPKNNYDWFRNWTSGNHIVDKFIQKIQLEAKAFHLLT